MLASEVEVGKTCRINYRPSTRVELDPQWSNDLSNVNEGPVIAFVTEDAKLLFVDPDMEVQESFGLVREGLDEPEGDSAKCGHIVGLVKTMKGILHLNVITPWIEDRIKEIAAETLKPGTDEVITDTYALDYIWGLTGDREIRGNQVYHRRAIDYYLGRTVDHGMWTGKLMKIAYEYGDERLPHEHEYFNHERVWLSDKDNPLNLPGRRIDYGIAIKFPCHCGKVEYDMFAIPGVHTGGFAYLVAEDTDNYLDIRNQIRVCEECAPKVESQLEAIERGDYSKD